MANANSPEWILQQAPAQVKRWNQQPFAQRLDEYLAIAWAPNSPNRSRALTTDFELGYMVRGEDCAIVQKYLDQYGTREKAFNLYWNSGLFDKAVALLNNLPQNLQDHAQADVELCKKFSELGLWGRCESMLSLFRQVDQVCDGILAHPNKLPNLLIVGETGTGKEKTARAFHVLTSRKEFRAINCAEFSSSPELMRSELFGHVKGAFTDAKDDKQGLLEICRDKGTLLFDEINSLAPGLQGGLLRVLQERKFRKVGGTEEIPVDTLFIAATNRNLDSLVEEKKFREDLLSRLSGVVFRPPALKERSEDIPLLVNQILLAYGPTAIDKGRDEFASSFRGRWRHLTGNVRQLEQEIGRWVQGTANPTAGGDSSQSQRRQAIEQAIEAAVEGGKSLPLSKAEVARRIKWDGKSKVSRSLLNDAAWRDIVQEFVRAGKIRG